VTNCRLPLLAIVVAIASLDARYAYSAEMSSGELAHVIQVEGHGEVRTSGDIAMTMTIENSATLADRAASLNAATTKRVLAAVSAKLGGKGRVDTAGYSLNPVYSNSPLAAWPSNYRCYTGFTIRTDSRDAVPVLLDTIQAASGGAVTAQANSQSPNQPLEIQLGVESRGLTASDCKQANATLIRKMMGPLKAKLGSRDRIEEASMSITPDGPSGVQNNNLALLGYRADNSLVVETSSFDPIGPSFDAAVAAGATQLGQCTVVLRDATKARSDAIVAASNDAQLRAQTVARALGVRVKRVLKILVVGEIQPQLYSGSFTAGAFPMRPITAPTLVEPGQITVAATVTVLYELE
jgi:uncharacterized protein YggE